MLVKTFGSAVYGVEAITITVEVNNMAGAKYFVVGLPDNVKFVAEGAPAPKKPAAAGRGAARPGAGRSGAAPKPATK